MLPDKRRLTELMGAGGGDYEGMSDMPVDTDALSNDDLVAMGGEGADYGDVDEMEINDLQAQLEDPLTSPQARQLIQARLALAARRRLAGVGGDSMLGGAIQGM